MGSYLFVSYWDSELGTSLNEARELLKTHGKFEHQLALSECGKLIEKGNDVMFRKEDIPEVYKPLSPLYIRASQYSCEINLYKAPGKGIGYWVTKSGDGQYELSWTDHFISWDSHKINVE